MTGMDHDKTLKVIIIHNESPRFSKIELHGRNVRMNTICNKSTSKICFG